MVTLGRKGKATLLVSVLLVVFTLALAALAFTYKPVSQPGEGYVDPASGIHISPAETSWIPQLTLRAQSSNVMETSTRSQAT